MISNFKQFYYKIEKIIYMLMLQVENLVNFRSHKKLEFHLLIAEISLFSNM